VIESYGARSALRGLSRRSAQYLEIRRLINEGYIPAGTEFSAESVRKMIGEPPERSDDIGISFDRARGTKRAFTRWDMYAWGDVKIRREVETAASTSLADWYTINRMSSKPCVSDEEAEIVFFDIITRSRQVSTVPG
jgi:hypothetical protein